MMTPREQSRRAHKYRMLATELHADLLSRRQLMSIDVRAHVERAIKYLEAAAKELEDTL